MEFYDFSNHFPGIYYDAFNGIIQEYKSNDQMGQVMRKRVILYANNKGAHQPDLTTSPRQHAFRKGHSCETQLTTVINDWAKILDNRGQVDTFILDFEKAFDTPPHELLKSKLFSYGIGGKTLKWIRFFSLLQTTTSCCKWSKI